MRKIIIAGHGDIAQGLKSSVTLIVGESAQDIITYALHPGDDATDFAKSLEKEITAHQDTEYVIFTDLYGASVFNAMTRLFVYDNVYLFSGMNLGLVLSSFLDPNSLDDKRCQAIVEEAQAGLLYFTGFDDEGEDNEF